MVACWLKWLKDLYYIILIPDKCSQIWLGYPVLQYFLHLWCMSGRPGRLYWICYYLIRKKLFEPSWPLTKPANHRNHRTKATKATIHNCIHCIHRINCQIFTRYSLQRGYSQHSVFCMFCMPDARIWSPSVTVTFFWSWRRRCVADLLEPWQIPRRSLASSHTDTDLGMNSESGILHHEVSRSVTSPKAQLNDARTHKSHKDTMHMLHLREPQIPVQGPSHLSLSTTTGSGAFQKMYRQVVGDLRNLQRSSHRWTIAIFVSPIASDQRKWLSESPQRLLHAVLWPWECWPAPSPTGLDIEET